MDLFEKKTMLFEEFEKMYDNESYNQIKMENEGVIIDFYVNQTIDDDMSDIGVNLTNLSLYLESTILKNLEKQFIGKWTTDSGSHGSNDEMVASVYIDNEQDAKNKIENILETDCDYSYENGECFINNAREYVSTVLLPEKDVTNYKGTRKEIDAMLKLIDSFSIDITITNPTNDIISLFE